MNIVYALLVHFVWFLSTYFVVLFILLLVENRKRIYDGPKELPKEMLPSVSIIVPAYNEEQTIADCIESLQKIDYPKEKYEIIVVNDGSKDKTSKVVNKYAGQIIFLDNTENKGKAASLNQGIARAKNEFIACMDADTIVPQDILVKTIPYFLDQRTGSVTVSVEVRHTNSYLQKIVQLEYVLGLSLFLKVFSLLDCVHVTPGPFSLYRKKMLTEIGNFDVHNITEDLEIAYRIHKAGYRIANCATTAVKTITPDTLKTLYAQRKRWYSGALLTLLKHKDMMLRKQSGVFGYFIPFNYLLITFGLGLFLFSTFLMISDLIGNIMLYSLVNYDFFSNWTWNFDVLALNSMTFFGVSGIIGMIALVTYGLSVSRKGPKKTLQLYIGYFILFFLYQFFWLVSYITVLSRRKVRW